MNTKGTKFLAVLAVLAMAFAAFAVIAPAEANDAIDGPTWSATDVTGTTAQIIAADSSTTIATDGVYYYEANATVTVPSGVTGVVILAEPDVVLTFQGSGASTWATSFIALLVADVTVDGTTVTATFAIEKTGLSASPGIAAWDPANKKADTELAFNTKSDAIALKATATGFNPVAGDYDVDLYANAYTLEGAYGTIVAYSDMEFALVNFTGTIVSDEDGKNVVKFTKFTGAIYIDEGIITIGAWDSGDAEVVTADDGGEVILDSNIPKGSTLYVDADGEEGASVESMAEDFTNNGTISIKQTRDSDGITGVGRFTLGVAMVNNGNINNLGVFDQNDFNITNNGKITTGEDIPEGIWVTWDAGDNGYVINNGTFTFKSTTSESKVKFALESTGDVINSTQSEASVSGDLTADKYGFDQKTVIIANSTLSRSLELDGLLVINEGVTLTLTGIGTIDMKYDQSVIINYGTIVVQGTGGIVNESGFVYNYGKIVLTDPSTEQNNTILSIGDAIDETSGFVKNYGTITLEAGVIDLSAYGSFMNMPGALFYNKSNVAFGNGALFSNAGAVKIDGKLTLAAAMADNTQIIKVTDKSATIEIVSLALPTETNSLTILNAVNETGNVGKIVLDSTSSAGTPAYNIITGLKIATYNGSSTSTANYGFFVVSGNVSFYTGNYGPIIGDTVYKIKLVGTTEYIGDLTLQEKVLLISDAAAANKFVVVGTMVAVNGSSAIIDNVAEITVLGKVIANVSPMSGTYTNDKTLTINAAMYVVTSDSYVKTYYYTTFENAVSEAYALDLAEITVTGKITVKDDITIPAPLKVKNQGELTIADGADVVISDGAELNNGKIVYVNGSLYAYDIDDITGATTSTAIVSDVKVVGNGDVLYTNLYDALGAADAGDVVVITKEPGVVVLTKDTIIPAGVTLDTNEKNLATYDATKASPTHYKLIVNGTLVLYAAGDFKSYDDVTLNGYIVSDDERTYNTTGITGAYFMAEDNNVDYYYIAGVKNLGDITATGVTEIGVYGDISVPALAFAGVDDAATVTFNNNVDVTTITASNAVIVFASGDVVKTTITDGTNSVALAGDVPASKTLTVTLGDKFKVGGAFDVGTVTAKNFVFKLTGTATVDAISVYNLNVAGNVTTAANVEVTKDVVVSGKLIIAKNKTFEAVNAMVTGEIEAIGSATITNVTIGSTTNAVAAAASVIGNVDATVVVLYAGNVVAESIVEDMKSTEFYIDGKLWFTVYSNGEVDLASITVPVTDAVVPNAVLSGDLAIVNGKLSGTFTPGDKASFDIAVKYDIYKVRIYTDAGVKSVAINGIELQTGFNQNYFETVINLEAGTYTVTCTLASGYSGESTLSVYDTHTVLKDNKFVLSGLTSYDKDDNGNYVLKLQLTGTEQSVAPEPSPVEEKEWTITTILLLVLVILIAVMAVIVALRLNRN